MTIDSPDLELVTVLETNSSLALTLAKSALDDAGIPYIVDMPGGGFLPGWHGTAGIGTMPLNWVVDVRLQVAPESEQQARELLANLQVQD